MNALNNVVQLVWSSPDLNSLGLVVSLIGFHRSFC
jgi:hypothetical protein